MRRLTPLIFLLAACVSMRPVFAWQTPTAAKTTASTVDRALLEQFVAATDNERVVLVAAHPEILGASFRSEFSVMGNALNKEGDRAGAARPFRAALFIAQQYKFADTEATSLNNIGMVFGQRGDLSVARTYLEQGLAVARANNDRPSIHSSLTNLAIVLRRSGDLDGALVSQLGILDTARLAGEPGAIARTLHNIGVVYYDMGNFARALEYYVESLGLKEQATPNAADIVTTLSNIGAVYTEQGDYALALEYFERARAFMVRTGAPPVALTSALNNMGHVYLAMGDPARARQSLNQSLALAEKTGDPVKIATPLYNLGNAARAEGRLDEAEALQRRALAIRESGEDRLGLIESLTEVAHVITHDARPVEALPYAERAVALAGASRLRSQEWKALLAVGNIHRELGHQAEARASYEAAITIIETIRLQTAGGERGRQKYLSDRLGPYYELAGLESEAGRAFESLTVVDRARARTLIDIIATGRPPTRQLTDAQREGERRATQALLAASSQLDTEAQKSKPDAQRLAELDSNLSKARIAREALLGELYAQQPSVGFARGNTPDLTRERLGDTLAPGAAIVTFVLADEETLAYVVTRGPNGPDVTTHALTHTTAQLTVMAARFAREVAARDLGFSASARALYDALLGPVEARLAGVTHMIVVPDGPLWQVPFQALQTSRGRFVIEDRAVSYAPSIAALTALESRDRSRADAAPYLVAFGDPAIAGANTTANSSLIRQRGLNTARLPEAAREVRAIGRLYGAKRSTVLVAADATEAALRERVSKATVLHVATHGVLDNGNPMYSQLLLTPGGAGATDHLADGRLEAWEVLDLGINARLAVLSACQTAGSGNGWGEGIIGLSWSLFAAGASTAVVSQWEVDSASTTSMMIAFHQRLMSPGKKTSTPEALRGAELTILRNPAYRHPFYWAGFISVGAK